MAPLMQMPLPTRFGRSFSTPEGQPSRTQLQRSNSLQGFCQPDEDSAEIQGLIQEFSYHTDLSHKQLQELWERLQVKEDASSPAVDHNTAESTCTGENEGEPSIQSGVAEVLMEFGMPTECEALRTFLEQHPHRHPLVKRKSSSKSSSETPRMGTTPASSLTSSRPYHRSTSSIETRMAVRLQISRFLQVPRNRVKVMKLWQHEADGLQVAQQHGNLLSRSGEKWYMRLYRAFEDMLSNLLDENDSAIREVVFDLVSNLAKRPKRKLAGDDNTGRPPEVESVRRAVSCFADAVLAVRAYPDAASGAERSAESQWTDCLSRVTAQFDQALDDTWRCLWPDAKDREDKTPAHACKSGTDGDMPLKVLSNAMQQIYENAELLCEATRNMAATAGNANQNFDMMTTKFWGAYLRQAVTVSKAFLKLAKEATLMTGLWTSGHNNEGEHLSDKVLQQEYKRVRRAFADLMLKQSREILAAWMHAAGKEVPVVAAFVEAHKDRHPGKKMLSAVIEWWRTGHSGLLRAACMDVVELQFAQPLDSSHNRQDSSCRLHPLSPFLSLSCPLQDA